MSHPWGEYTATYDDSFKEAEVVIPDGVHEDDVEVVAHYCNMNGHPDPNMVGVMLKGKVHRDPPLSNPPVEPEPSVDEHSPAGDSGESHAEDVGPVGEADLKQEEPAAKPEEEVVEDEAAMLAAWAAEEAAKNKPE